MAGRKATQLDPDLIALSAHAAEAGVKTDQLVDILALQINVEKRPGGAMTTEDVRPLGLRVAEVYDVLQVLRNRRVLAELKEKIQLRMQAQAVALPVAAPIVLPAATAGQAAGAQKTESGNRPERGPIAEMAAEAADFMQGSHPDQLNAVCELFKVTPIELMTPSRRAKVATPRAALRWLLKETTSRSLPDIANRFLSIAEDDSSVAVFGIDHTTVLHSQRTIAFLVQSGGATEDEQPHKIITADIAGKLKVLAESLRKPTVTPPQARPAVPHGDVVGALTDPA